MEIKFIVEEKAKDSDKADQQSIQSASGGATPAIFLEMRLEKTVTAEDGTAKPAVLIPESSVLIKSVIPLPAGLQGKYSYKIIRVHDGATQTLTMTANSDGERIEVDADKTTLTVYAKKFSTYAIAYSDPPPSPAYWIPPTMPTTPTKPTESTDPEDTQIEDELVPTESSPDQTGVSILLNTDEHFAYMSGYSSGEFAPGDYITRAQVAQVFYNLLLDQDVSGAPYDDVPAGAWYARAVSAMRGLRIMDGVGGNRFEPDRPITRGEFAVTAMRFALSQEEGENIFSDVSEEDWYYGQIVAAAHYGWISGYGDGTYRPKNPITRAEVVKIVNNMLGRSPDKAYIDAHQDALRQFPDVSRDYWARCEITEAVTPHEYQKDEHGEEWTGLK